MPKKITVNGHARALPDHENLLKLINDDLGYAAQDNGISFVVAINAEIRSVHQWKNTALHDGDFVDILGAITGG